MRIYRPVKTNSKVQAFGENLPCVKLNEDGTPIQPFQVITPSTNVCPVGYTKFYTAINMLGHNGEDWAAYHGEPVYFPVVADGIEWQAATEVDKDGGIGVRVRSTTPVALDILPPQAHGSLNMIKAQYDKYGGKCYLEFLFWHLEKPNVYDKQPVVPGQLIGYADSTGASSGDHVHFALKISSDTSWFTLDGDNGYAGAIDFDHWFENTFILDSYAPPSFKYSFVSNLAFGQSGVDILNLQKALTLEGVFPQSVNPTGYFGEITAKAVLDFRLKYTISSATDPRGYSVGPLTRAQLNHLYST